MYENIIFEEDSIYEIDVECMCEKEKKEESALKDKEK